MKRMFGILALMVIASIMIAGCVQPTGNETATPGTTPGVTETPMATETPMVTETMMANETATETMMANETATETMMANETATETMMANETVTETMMANETVTETPPGTPTALIADEIVSITDSGYVPDTLTVPVGTTVGWTNDASTTQTVSATGAAGFFDSGMLQPGDSYSYTFNGAGNYTYQSLTTGLEGEVIVAA